MGERRKYKPLFLKAWRKRAGLTQEQLADRVGVSVSLISMIERGQRQYDQDFLEKAAAIFGIAPDALIRVNPDEPASPDALAEQMRRIPEADRPRAMAVLEAFVRPPPFESKALKRPKRSKHKGAA